MLKCQQVDINILSQFRRHHCWSQLKMPFYQTKHFVSQLWFSKRTMIVHARSSVFLNEFSFILCYRFDKLLRPFIFYMLALEINI
jgi:hypothetical protein